ncbi:MAG: ATP-dependent DNA helicase [Flavobacteriaceae bacterium]
MSAYDLQSEIKKNSGFPLTHSQELWVGEVSEFVTEKKDDNILILRGYAGTGKSSMIALLVGSLSVVGQRAVLLAPTGRAAKVLSAYSKKKAFTIHKKIYFSNAEGGQVRFRLKNNTHRNTLFIVDESSMIGEDSSGSRIFDRGSLLHDLVQYVEGGDNCKLIFVGDTAQLPPVHLMLSPALNPEKLEYEFNKTVPVHELEEVVRQQLDSGILYNATRLREFIASEDASQFIFQMEDFPDVVRLEDGNEFMELLSGALQKDEEDSTVLIVRSNKRANQYNQSIRQRILFLESDLAIGDSLMVVKNNYHWLSEEDPAGFIANGDTLRVQKIHTYKELYGFKFAQVTVQMADYPDQDPFETTLLLDTLHANTASLSQEQSQQLYQKVNEDYAHITSKYKRLQKVKENPYFNALQVKYSYAITCHKSQGGQWREVFVEMPYLPEGPSVAFYRWLYTALTRAQEKLYLIGFSKDYFESTI